MAKKRPILVICAHNEDVVIGAGGTLANAVRSGGSFKTVIFSFGESAQPHIKPEIVVERRIKESLRCDKILGGEGIAYLGLKQRQFKSEIEKKKVYSKLTEVIKRENPSRIYTHMADDSNHDHRNVNAVVMKLISDNVVKCEVYGFESGNLINWKHKEFPMLVVDISNTFETKIAALRAHKSQQVQMPGWIAKLYLKNMISGFNNHCRYAEVFYKLF